MVAGNAQQGLLYSLVVTSVALFAFGYVKGRFTGIHPFSTALQTLFIGGIAAGAAFWLAKAISR
jgi:VIT1/CCC1 family predicted Fe2+/Mn2+ transporter